MGIVFFRSAYPWWKGLLHSEQKTFDAFLNAIKNNITYKDYLLFDQKYEHEKKNRDDNSKTETYKNKIEAIEQIQNGIRIINTDVVKVDKNKLCNMMRCYLAVKIIRNHWNHAGDNQTDSSREYAKEKLKKAGIILALDVDGIYELLDSLLKEEL